MSCPCADKHDKCIMSKLNICGQKNIKGKAGTTTQSKALGNGECRVMGAPNTASMCHHTPLSLAHGSLFASPGSLQAAIPESLHLSKQEQFHKNRYSLAIWGGTEVWLCCLLHERDGGLRAPLSVGTVLWNPMHSLTRGHTAAPRG